MAIVKHTAKGKHSYTAVSITVETYRRKARASGSYRDRPCRKKKACH